MICQDLLSILILFTAPYLLVAQELKSNSLKNNLMIEDRGMNLSFLNIGNARKVDSTTYSIDIEASDNVRRASIEIAVTGALFVNLPGTYGGRLFLNPSTPGQVMKSLVLSDSVWLNQNKFERQYWVSYAGMGLWEGVINCYRKENGKYYVVSLVQDESLGQPEKKVDSGSGTFEFLQMKMLKSLLDTTSVTVKLFNRVAGSLKIVN